MCITKSLYCTIGINNIVNQSYFNKNKEIREIPVLSMNRYFKASFSLAWK